jgi:hypothetical protein
MNIPIKKAKEVREQLGLTHLVIFGVDSDGVRYVATHGKSKVHAREAADAGNRLKSALDWPLHHCNSEPVERVCRTCESVKGHNAGSGQWFYECCVEPPQAVGKVSSVSGDRPACRHYECKY